MKKTFQPKCIVILIMAATLLLCSGATQAINNSASPSKTNEKLNAAQVKPDGLAEKWGVVISSVRLSAHNHMIDFRYRVLDNKKADKLFSSKRTKPYMIHQKTGKVLAIPRTAKVGPLMSTYQHKQGRIYWMFFGNPNLIKSGDKVSVVIGEFRADNIVVQ